MNIEGGQTKRKDEANQAGRASPGGCHEHSVPLAPNKSRAHDEQGRPALRSQRRHTPASRTNGAPDATPTRGAEGKRQTLVLGREIQNWASPAAGRGGCGGAHQAASRRSREDGTHEPTGEGPQQLRRQPVTGRHAPSGTGVHTPAPPHPARGGPVTVRHAQVGTGVHTPAAFGAAAGGQSGRFAGRVIAATGPTPGWLASSRQSHRSLGAVRALAPVVPARCPSPATRVRATGQSKLSAHRPPCFG